MKIAGYRLLKKVSDFVLRCLPISMWPLLIDLRLGPTRQDKAYTCSTTMLDVRSLKSGSAGVSAVSTLVAP